MKRLSRFLSPNTIIALAAAAGAVAAVHGSLLWVVVTSLVGLFAHFWGEFQQFESCRKQADSALLFLSKFVFNDDSGFRFSIFMAARGGNALELARRFRKGDGFSSNGSKTWFIRGSGLAGLALQNVDRFLDVDVPHFGSDRDAFLHFHSEQLGMPDHQAHDLSSFMMGVRTIGCIGINGYYSERCIAVLCIDSLYPDVFRPEIKEQIAVVAAFLSIVLEA